MVGSGPSNRDEREPIVSYSKETNRVSWFSDTDFETDPDEDILVNGGPIHHYKAVTRRKRPYSVRYKEYCANKRTKKRVLLLVLVVVFLIVIIGLVYLYYSKTSLQEVAKDPKTRLTVEIDCGKLLGSVHKFSEGSVYSFKGIRYAQPPVDSRRWKPPVALDGRNCWHGTYDATEFGSQCAQLDPTTNLPSGTEDCLYLNVITPSTNSKSRLPVVVWIHGGNLMTLNGTVRGCYPDIDFVTNAQVVAVTINYRLNVFGFLTLDILSQVALTNSSGNYGFMDQILALKWVKQNIRHFGGDPARVTVVGQSSGGTSVFALLASPLTKGLITNAVSMSGSAVITKSFRDASKDNKVFLKNAQCDQVASNDSLHCLYNLTTNEALLAVPSGMWAMKGMDDLPLKGEYFQALAVIDPVVLPYPPSEIFLHKSLCKKRISLLVGTTAQETGLDPPVCFAKQAFAKYSKHVHARLNSFSKTISDEAISMYGNKTSNSQLNYETMTTDVRMTCPSNFLSHSFAKSKCHNSFRYVVTNSPSHPVLPGTCSFTNAHHTWDMNALFGFKMTSNIFKPQTQDLDFMNELQLEIIHFIKYGHPYNSRWGLFPASVGVFSDRNLEILENEEYHKEKCKFWAKNGFYSYGWVN